MQTSPPQSHAYSQQPNNNKANEHNSQYNAEHGPLFNTILAQAEPIHNYIPLHLRLSAFKILLKAVGLPKKCYFQGIFTPQMPSRVIS